MKIIERFKELLVSILLITTSTHLLSAADFNAPAPASLGLSFSNGTSAGITYRGGTNF